MYNKFLPMKSLIITCSHFPSMSDATNIQVQLILPRYVKIIAPNSLQCDDYKTGNKVLQTTNM